MKSGLSAVDALWQKPDVVYFGTFLFSPAYSLLRARSRIRIRVKVATETLRPKTKAKSSVKISSLSSRERKRIVLCDQRAGGTKMCIFWRKTLAMVSLGRPRLPFDAKLFKSLSSPSSDVATTGGSNKDLRERDAARTNVKRVLRARTYQPISDREAMMEPTRFLETFASARGKAQFLLNACNLNWRAILEESSPWSQGAPFRSLLSFVPTRMGQALSLPSSRVGPF